MKLARDLSAIEIKKIQNLILFGGVFVTLAIWTKLEDPINLPKMFVLAMFSAIVLGLSAPAIINIRKLISRSQINGLILVALFVLGLFISTLATDVKYTAIFGEYHRNNGALSYFGAAIFLACSILVFNIESVSRFLFSFANLGLVVSTYGFLQVLGLDPVNWVIVYNPVITTLGNPNFTSGILGLTAIATFLLILENRNPKIKIFYSLALLLELFVLIKSNSVQGGFALLAGISIVILTKIWSLNRKVGIVAFVFSGLIGLFVALGVFNAGPLASRLSQNSLGNRLDYWNAAISMFKSHPFFGVGIDRFGEFYREYAVQNQVAQGQVTDNAHSLYLQILSTGGLITFVPYMLLIIFITYLGLRKVISTSGSEKITTSGILGIWVGALVLNLVTIDNLGVGIWCWISGGILVSVSSLDHKTIKGENARIVKNQKNSAKTFFPYQSILAAVFTIVVLILLVPSLNKSSTLFTLKNSMGGFTSETYVKKLGVEYKTNQNDPQYLIQLANLALQQNSAETALKIVERVNQIDPRSFYGNLFPALTYEALGKKDLAIKYRERLMALDPWNNASLIELMKDYLSVGNRASAEAIASLIKQNYPGSQSDIEAAALLVG